MLSAKKQIYRADSGFVQMRFEKPGFTEFHLNDLHKTSLREV
ncbi:hypothetical protein Halhy_4107 [Haliscomenobacter hydrossis DSM 1100]|uniref:Uncharacterized protein n=1 Tax=Haliscomenobacter hydrossis (strain ATCC 27775 / DSM 1100 / LMG 10767 / O) TaxID=760192 RepID=F4L6Z8_HALH1|nr:hypothetical protein Halhy_4107 [Haliscomenobacter hydrossis DSM 1100]